MNGHAVKIKDVFISNGSKNLETSFNPNLKTNEIFDVKIINLDSKQNYNNYYINITYKGTYGYDKKIKTKLETFNIEDFDITTSKMYLSEPGKAKFKIDLKTRGKSNNNLSIIGLTI